MVALPCGSRSISRTRRRVAAREAARLTAVVVLPTPPFWLATAITRFMRVSVHCLCHHPAAALRQSLARHLIGNRARGPALTAGTLEDLREARGNPVDLRLHLDPAGVTAILVRDTDDAAGIDHIIGGVEDSRLHQRVAVVVAGELIVRSARD